MERESTFSEDGEFEEEELDEEMDGEEVSILSHCIFVL